MLNRLFIPIAILVLAPAIAAASSPAEKIAAAKAMDRPALQALAARAGSVRAAAAARAADRPGLQALMARPALAGAIMSAARSRPGSPASLRARLADLGGAAPAVRGGNAPARLAALRTRAATAAHRATGGLSGGPDPVLMDIPDSTRDREGAAAEAAILGEFDLDAVARAADRLADRAAAAEIHTVIAALERFEAREIGPRLPARFRTGFVVVPDLVAFDPSPEPQPGAQEARVHTPLNLGRVQFN